MQNPEDLSSIPRTHEFMLVILVWWRRSKANPGGLVDGNQPIGKFQANEIPCLKDKVDGF